MNKKTIPKEHRVLDDTDLNNIDNKFELFKTELQSSREKFEYELKHSREVTDSKIDSLKWLLGFLVAVITTVFVSGLTALLIKLFF